MHVERKPLSLVRRAALAGVALACVAVLFRGAIALGLVARGDELVQGGVPARAMTYYDRAWFFAPGDALIADRATFAALMSRDAALERRALAYARRALAGEPRSVALRFDRARLAHAVGAEAQSCDAYAELGATTADWRYSEFAAQCARKLGRVADAKRAFAHVLALMPQNGVARRELALLQHRVPHGR
jgi:tetratricopeptide (TPR) repeat protein